MTAILQPKTATFPQQKKKNLELTEKQKEKFPLLFLALGCEKPIGKWEKQEEEQ